MKFGLKLESVIWAISSLLLILSTNFYWLEHSSRVIAPLHKCVLPTKHVWQLPLAVWISNEAWAVWPFYVFAVVAAILIAAVTTRAAQNGFGKWTILVLPGLSLAIQPDQLFTALLVVTTCRLLATEQARKSTVKFAGISISLLGIATIISLDFGLVALIAVGLSGSHFVAHLRANKQPIMARYTLVRVVLIIVTVLIILMDDGFSSAFFRPLNWLWRNTELMPSLTFLSGSPAKTAAQLLLGLILLKSVWHSLQLKVVPWPDKLMSVVLAAIGLGCGHYTPLAVIALCELRNADSTLKSRLIVPVARMAMMPSALLGLTVLYWSWLLSNNGLSAIGGTSQPRMVDATLWQFDGAVMLTNRDHSVDWQSAVYQNRFPLLIDDRWDAEVENLQFYTAAVHDLHLGLREFHLKSNLTGGGYRCFLDQYQPVAIAVDSTETETIRHFSVDPEWRVMSVDSQRTIFGSSQSELTRSQTIRASELLFQLEWPRQNVSMRLEGIIALGTNADSRAVANVLTAIRLPYAALRVLPNDGTASTEQVRTWAYVELAHRALRETGQPSLLDHSRAFVALKRLQNNVIVSRSEREKIQRAVSSLQKVNLTIDTTPQGIADLPESEISVRHAVWEGEIDAAVKACNSISDSNVQTFYRFILSCSESSLEDAVAGLQKILELPELPIRIREEATFYCACMELELGNVVAAGILFNDSAKLRSDSALSPLRALYLSQLSETQRR
jgi:hypothetical protein